MPQVVLDEPQIATLVREVIAAGVPQLMAYALTGSPARSPACDTIRQKALRLIFSAALRLEHVLTRRGLRSRSTFSSAATSSGFIGCRLEREPLARRQ